MPVDATVYIVTYIEVSPASADLGAHLLSEYRAAARRQPGNLTIELLRRIDRPGHFATVAAWTDPSSAESGAQAVKPRLDELVRILLSPSDERVHAGLFVASPRAGVAAGLWVLTHVDVVPLRKDDGVALLERLAAESRRDAGCARFDVVQQTSRPNHLTVVEAWEDRAAFDAHAAAPHTRQFRERLAPMSGALYDERLYAAR
jgi:quinol monooxygenase YgiN